MRFIAAAAQVESALEALAAAVWTPKLWPDALEALACAFDSRYVTVVNVVSTRTGEVTCSRGAREAIEHYLNRRDIPDSRDARVNPHLGEGFRTDLDDFSLAEVARDPYYQEFLRPLDIGWHAAAALPGFNNETLVISLKRAPAQGMFSRGDVAALNAALPRLRALARQATTLAQCRFDGALQAFERNGRGALVIDRYQRVVAANGRIAFGDGLHLRHGRLSAAHAEDDQRLAAAVTTATGGGTPLPLVLRRPSGKRPFVVDVIGPPPGSVGDALGQHALLVVNDLDRSPRPRREVLRRTFDLTPREVDLALHLAAGTSLQEAAAAMAISEGHARQRVKALLAKTACSSQAELRALLVRMD